MGDRELTLYHYTMCPYCMRVRRFLAAHDVTVTEKNIRRDPAARRELIEAGGKSQVPALMIDGDVLYESNEIIRWFEQNVIQTDGVKIG